MNNQQVRLQKKLTALNKIRKIYHPFSKFSYSNYKEDGSYAEQRDYAVREIIETLEKELNFLKEKNDNI